MTYRTSEAITALQEYSGKLWNAGQQDRANQVGRLALDITRLENDLSHRHSEERMRVVVTGLLWRQRSLQPGTIEFLVTRRAKELKFMPGMWVIPGGGVKSDDYAQFIDGGADARKVLETALYRELHEECGSTLRFGNFKLLDDVIFRREDGINVLVLSFMAPHLSGNPALSREVCEVKWVTPAEAMLLDMPGDSQGEIADAYILVRATQAS